MYRGPQPGASAIVTAAVPSPFDRSREFPDTFEGWSEWSGMARSTMRTFPWHPRVPVRLRRWPLNGMAVLLDVPAGLHRDLMEFVWSLSTGSGGIGGWTGRHGALLALLHLAHDHPLDTARLILVGGGLPAVRAYPWGGP